MVALVLKFYSCFSLNASNKQPLTSLPFFGSCTPYTGDTRGNIDGALKIMLIC